MTDTPNTPPVIFLTFANDRSGVHGYLNELPEEARRLRDVLTGAEKEGLCELVVRFNVTPEDVFKVFQDSRYRNRIAIFHYGGHANGYELLLESAKGNANTNANASGLADFFSVQQGMQLAFLNGCSTEQQTDALLNANVGSVISTTRPIEDELATSFALHFYQGLAGGADIHEAFRQSEAVVKTLTPRDPDQTRSVRFANQPDLKPGDATWKLFGEEAASQWSLPMAINNALFGLPSLPELDLPTCPYRRLAWFEAKHAEIFYGRNRQIRELYDRITDSATSPVLLLYGQSGVGKSSLLDAGLIPRLSALHDVHYVRRVSGGLMSSLSKTPIGSLTDVDSSSAWCTAEQALGRPLTIVLDQVEEVFTRSRQNGQSELKEFLEFCRDTFCDPERRPVGNLILGFRKEWLAELDRQFQEMQIPTSRTFLEPLDRDSIVEVVNGPTQSQRACNQYNLTVEAGLAELIADDLSRDTTSSIGPTLQILLGKMWDAATLDGKQPRFDRELYQKMKTDLGEFLRQQLRQFNNHAELKSAETTGLLIDLLEYHTTSIGSANQHPIADLQERYCHVPTPIESIIQRCEELYLLTTSTDDQGQRVSRLTHDTLAPLVRELHENSHHPGQRARRILDNRKVDWSIDHGTPLDQADLNLVEEGLQGTRNLDPMEVELVNASREVRRKEWIAMRLRQSAFALAGIAMAIAAIIANYQRNAAIEHARVAQVEAKESEMIKEFFIHHLKSERVSQFGKRYDDVDANIVELGIRDQQRRAEIHNQLGNVFIKLAKADDAEAKKRQALEMLLAEPESTTRTEHLATIRVELGLLRVLQGREDEALELLEVALADMDALGYEEHKEPRLSTTVLHCMALSGSKESWDQKRMLANEGHFDETLERLRLAQDPKIHPRLVTAITMTQIVNKFRLAGSDHVPALQKPRLVMQGINKMNEARKYAKTLSTNDAITAAINLYDELFPFWYAQFNPLASKQHIEQSTQVFLKNTNKLVDRLGEEYGHFNPAVLELQLARAKLVPDRRLKQRLLLSVLDAARKATGRNPAYASYVYAYVDFLTDEIKRTQDDKAAKELAHEAEVLIRDLIDRLNEHDLKFVDYRIGHAWLRLGRVLKLVDSKIADGCFAEAWRQFENAGVKEYTFLGGQKEFDSFRQPITIKD
ncbi:MAG: CHAT domain-containing protein [Planctomycetota bacterium]